MISKEIPNQNVDSDIVDSNESAAEKSFSYEGESDEQKIIRLKDLAFGKLDEYWEKGDKDTYFYAVPRFNDELLKVYTRAELQKSRLYHALIGSTTDEISSPLVDLPNGEIEKFIMSL